MVASITKVLPDQTYKKSFSPIDLVSFPEFLLERGFTDLSAYAAILLYKQAMPLFNSVDKRGTYFSHIPIRIRDEDKKLVNDHPSFELFKRPNSDLTTNEFLYQISSYLDVTGNSFILGTGRVERPPVEVMTVAPHRTTFGFGKDRFGFLNIPESIRISESNIGQVTFWAEDTPDKGLRYYNRDRDMELWHIRQFNPLRSSANFWGMSKALPVWLELQNYISGNNTNWSMLKRGTRLSMAWVNNTGTPLTDDQWNRMQEEAQRYSGDVNSHGTPVLDGMDVKTIQQTNRDMEFKDLQDNMLFRVSTIYGIPLAMLAPQTMTLNNLETSMLQLYDNAIIPLSLYIYAELSNFLMPRFGTPNLNYSFSPHDIPALQSRIIANVEKQQKISVNTDNEIRTLLGDEEIDGGDAVYKPVSLVPVGQDRFTEDNLQEPVKRMQFIKFMKRHKNLDGSQKYSPEELEVMADQRYAT